VSVWKKLKLAHRGSVPGSHSQHPATGSIEQAELSDFNQTTADTIEDLQWVFGLTAAIFGDALRVEGVEI
jgi:hypothetical protein